MVSHIYKFTSKCHRRYAYLYYYFLDIGESIHLKTDVVVYLSHSSILCI